MAGGAARSLGADFACAILAAPAAAYVAIVTGVALGAAGGKPLGDHGLTAGFACLVLTPPATVLLRARARGLSLGWRCLLVSIAFLAVAAMLAVFAIAIMLVFAYVMCGWDGVD